MGEIMSRTKYWLDVTSLGPPDGEFMTQFKKALRNIADTANKQGGDPITVRMLFGNIIGMPVDVDAVMTALTADLDTDKDNIEVWVGAWRKGVSWNHSKIIAVDGKYLHNGGHNLWDAHYLQGNPVHDISMEAEGQVAHDGHYFANEMWSFIKKEQSKRFSCTDIVSSMQSSVGVVEWPEGIDEFPPVYKKSGAPKYNKVQNHIPMITMGRFGALLYRERPSDDAIVAMIAASKTIIHMTLQDLGPICIPNLDRVTVPGCVWPNAYLKEIGSAIYERGVDIEIALSTPGSIPNGMSATEALYGNGWTCADVASEIVKAIQENYDVDDKELRKMVDENLRICYVKSGGTNQWANNLTKGNHAKHFIIDDKCYYIGSQNLYMCDLAEWGILTDDPKQCQKVMQEYWNPMWKESYGKSGDCSVDEVMNALDIDRNGADESTLTAAELVEAHQQGAKHPGHDTYHNSE